MSFKYGPSVLGDLGAILDEKKKTAESIDFEFTSDGELYVIIPFSGQQDLYVYLKITGKIINGNQWYAVSLTPFDEKKYDYFTTDDLDKAMLLAGFHKNPIYIGHNMMFTRNFEEKQPIHEEVKSLLEYIMTGKGRPNYQSTYEQQQIDAAEKRDELYQLIIRDIPQCKQIKAGGVSLDVDTNEVIIDVVGGYFGGRVLQEMYEYVIYIPEVMTGEKNYEPYESEQYFKNYDALLTELHTLIGDLNGNCS
jgi:hypothetical protein